MSTSSIIITASAVIVLVLGIKLVWLLRWLKRQPEPDNEVKKKSEAEKAEE